MRLGSFATKRPHTAGRIVNASGENLPPAENDIAREIVDCAYQVHVTIGPGLLETIYQRALHYELASRGIEVRTEVPIVASYKGHPLRLSYRADMLVADLVVVELKSVEYSPIVHKKQLLTYLRLMDKRLGLLINFGSPTIKKGITRVVNGLREDGDWNSQSLNR